MDAATHGDDGPLSVSDLHDPNPVDHEFITAAGQLQLRPYADFNVAEPKGVGIYQVTQRDGARHSTGRAFLAPIRARANLQIVTGAKVTGLEVATGAVRGVTLRRSGGFTGLRGGCGWLTHRSCRPSSAATPTPAPS